jgi:hypothetical protein
MSAQTESTGLASVGGVTANPSNKFIGRDKRNAIYCFLCKTPIAEGVPLAIRKVPHATPHGTYKAREVICLECDGTAGLRLLPAFYCKTCNRAVFYHKRTNLPRYCSWICRHAAQLVKPVSVVCAVCKKQFVPQRNDARACSSACRQKAYRRRTAAPSPDIRPAPADNSSCVAPQHSPVESAP